MNILYVLPFSKVVKSGESLESGYFSVEKQSVVVDLDPSDGKFSRLSGL